MRLNRLWLAWVDSRGGIPGAALRSACWENTAAPELSHPSGVRGCKDAVGKPGANIS